MQNWLNYLRYNRSHRRTIPWDKEFVLDPLLRPHLIASLQRFQVGESGEGRHLRKQAATTHDPVYEEAIDLFIKEEQEHARLMAEIIKRLNAPLLTSHWSDGCFILLRRLFGLNEELLVLLIPEIIAKRYFRAVHDGTKDEIIRAVCAQILYDENGHVAFHVEYLQKAFAGYSLLKRVLVRAGWRFLFRAACVVLIFDHYKILRASGVSAGEFWWDCGLLFDETAAAILNFAPAQLYPAPVFDLKES